MTLLVGLTVERDIKHERFATIIDILIIAGIAVLMVFYFTASIAQRPTKLVEKDWRDLDGRGLRLYEHDCLCTNQTLPVGSFVTYPFDDADYAYCDGEFKGLAGQPGSIICVTASYKLWALIHTSAWKVSSDAVVSEHKLAADLSSKVGELSFDTWNLLSDTVRVAHLLLDRSIRTGAVTGDLTQLGGVYNLTYDDFLAIEEHLPALETHLRSTLALDNKQYLEQCAPRECFEVETVPITNLGISAAAVVGGYFSIFAAVGKFIVKMREDAYLRELQAKAEKGTITRVEYEFLTSNSPEMSAELMEARITARAASGGGSGGGWSKAHTEPAGHVGPGPRPAREYSAPPNMGKAFDTPDPPARTESALPFGLGGLGRVFSSPGTRKRGFGGKSRTHPAVLQRALDLARAEAEGVLPVEDGANDEIMAPAVHAQVQADEAKAEAQAQAQAGAQPQSHWQVSVQAAPQDEMVELERAP